MKLTLAGTGNNGGSGATGRTGNKFSSGTAGTLTAASATAPGLRKGKQGEHAMSCPPLTGAASPSDASDTSSAYFKRNNVTHPSPELLFSSGRISASRYHEILAELDKKR